MTHVVKIDIITGFEEIGNLHVIQKIILLCIFIDNNAIAQNLYSQL